MFNCQIVYALRDQLCDTVLQCDKQKVDFQKREIMFRLNNAVALLRWFLRVNAFAK